MPTSQMRRNPFGALDPTVSRMWDWFATPMGHTPLSKFFGESSTFVPPVDIYETQDEVLIAASLPGVNSETLDIKVTEQELSLSGEQQSVMCFEPEEGAVQHVAGIPRYGRFSFLFPLPCAVDASQTQARYKDGMLCLRFLKASKSRPIRVAIHPQEEAQEIVKPAAIEQSAQPSEPQSTRRGRKEVSK